MTPWYPAIIAVLNYSQFTCSHWYLIYAVPRDAGCQSLKKTLTDLTVEGVSKVQDLRKGTNNAILHQGMSRISCHATHLTKKKYAVFSRQNVWSPAKRFKFYVSYIKKPTKFKGTSLSFTKLLGVHMPSYGRSQSQGPTTFDALSSVWLHGPPYRAKAPRL